MVEGGAWHNHDLCNYCIKWHFVWHSWVAWRDRTDENYGYGYYGTWETLCRWCGAAAFEPRGRAEYWLGLLEVQHPPRVSAPATVGRPAANGGGGPEAEATKGKGRWLCGTERAGIHRGKSKANHVPGV